MKKFDLHNHTVVSKDGAIEARKIIELAAQRGLLGIGICDHDEFPDENLYDFAKLKGIKLALGVEFSCKDAHIIGFNMKEISDDDKKFLNEKFDELRNDYVTVAETIVKSLIEFGERISTEQVKQAYGKERIQKLFVMKYMAEHLDMGFKSWSDARKWLQRKEDERQTESKEKGEIFLKPSFYPKDGSGIQLFDPLDIIDIIHRSGGFAIWAHPFITPEAKRLTYFDEFHKKGIGAIEANYAYQENGYKGNETNELIETQVRKLLSEMGIPASGGSDSHFPLKTYKDKTPIMPGDYGINQDEISKIEFIFG